MLLKEQIDRTQWPEQRNSGSVLALTQINAILSQFDEVQAHRVTIRYPGGDLGNAWALEVRDWLVALGMPSDVVTLEPGSGGSDQLILLLEKDWRWRRTKNIKILKILHRNGKMEIILIIKSYALY